VATVIAQAVAAGLSMAVLFKGKSHLHVHMHHWIPDWALSWRILRIGLPSSGQMLTRSLMNAIMMRIVAVCGTAAVAAYGTGMRFHMLVLMPAFALGGAAATMVGQNLGAGQPDRAKKAAWMATWIDMGFMAVCLGFLMLFATSLIGFFNTDPEVVRIGARYLLIVSPGYFFAALGIVLGRALNGAGDSVSPMVFTILSLWGLQVPLAIYLSRIWNPSMDGIWWAISAAMMVHGLLITAWFEVGRWKNKKV
ncbi:MAG: MATE family efflux transporter, partial [Lentisphaerota bacterium]